MLTILIGDVHGQAEALARLLEAVDFEVARRGEPHELIFLSDLLDRGPECARALLMAHRRTDAVMLKGNHEMMMADCLFRSDSKKMRRQWLFFATGGGNTVEDFAEAFGIKIPVDFLDEAHDDLLDRLSAELCDHFDPALRAWLECERPEVYWRMVGERFLAVHAGVEPDLPVAEQGPDTLAWIREPFLDHAGPYADRRIVIHGHTPQIDGRPEIRSNRINLDVGSFATGLVAAAIVNETERLGILMADDEHCWRYVPGGRG